MPNFTRMYQLIDHNKSTGHHFFSQDTMKFFSSRIQTMPPYGGRVFVTSERMNWNSPRLYTVRMIRPDGSINTINPDLTFRSEGFQYFTSHKSAHRFAASYAAENFVVFENKSIEIPMERAIV